MKQKTLQIEVLVGHVAAREYSFGTHNFVGLPHEGAYKFKFTNLGTTNGDAVLHIDGKYINTFRVRPGRPAVIECSGNDNDRKFVFFKEESHEVNTISPGLKGNANNGLVKVEWKPERSRMTFTASSTVPLSGTILLTDGVGTMSWGQPYRTINVSGNLDLDLDLEDDEEDCNEMAGVLNESTTQSDSTRQSCNVRASSTFGKKKMRGTPDLQSHLSSGLTMFGGSSGQKFVQVPDITDIDPENACTIIFRLAHDTQFGNSFAQKYSPVQTHQQVPPRVENLAH